MGANPKYPQAFKRKAVELARRGDRTQGALAKDLGVSSRQLRRWLRRTEAEESMAEAVKRGAVPLDALKIAKLERRITQLEEANQALSEANRFFALRRRK